MSALCEMSSLGPNHTDKPLGRPEHGGNCDIKNLSRGSKVYLPVHVKGAKFSVGDLHFSQGDGMLYKLDSIHPVLSPYRGRLIAVQVRYHFAALLRWLVW